MGHMGCARQRSNTPVAEATGVVAEAACGFTQSTRRGDAALVLMPAAGAAGVVAEAAGVVAEAACFDGGASKVKTGIGVQMRPKRAAPPQP